MAKSSSSSPYLNRSTHKTLEYTSCIDTYPISTTSTNQNTHSSIDTISQPKNANHLDVNVTRKFNKLDLNKKQLDRTESISLPTTPTEEIPPLLLNHSCHSLLNLSSDPSTKNTHLNSSTEYIHATSNQSQTIECDSTRKSPLHSTIFSSSPSSSTDLNIPISYGVDWSDQVCPTSHCWFPFNPSDPNSSPACSYYSCKNPKPTLILSLVRCESCLIVVHTHHLTNIRTNDFKTFIPSCRPSFIDENQLEYIDQHFWSNISVLTKPCAFCKRKSASSSIFNQSKTTNLPTTDLMNNKSPIPGSPLLSTTSCGFQCLWCSRSYHRRCWEQVFTNPEKQICDYGVYRNIIVRPQWIRRISHSSSQFRAQYLSSSPIDFDKTSTPVLLFINKRSGGQSGEKIYHKLLRLLNPRQVFLLEDDQTIQHALDIYSSLSNVRICVFGGDGTVGWILGRLAQIYPSLNNPPVCICPLGTGNDLSRVLSWGDQYDPKRLLSTLIQISYAQVIALDRWQVNLEPLDENRHVHRDRRFLSLFTPPKFIRDTKRPSYQNHRTLPNTCFINYMSFGLDAAIALEFHDRRSRDPRKFSSPLKNKLMYLNESRKYLNDFARSKMWNLRSYIRLICDGENLTDSIKNCHTLLVLNIPGYASGTNPWGKSSTSSSSSSSAAAMSIQKDSDSFEQISTSSVDCIDLPANTHEVYELITLNECSTDGNTSSATSITTMNSNSTGKFERQDFGDKKIEVVGLSTTHMATIHIGFRGTRIAQCNQLRIELCCPMTAQMDGEPFYLPESVAVNITHAGQVLVLRNENR